ncbi:MAG: hypothetical protein RR343_05015 [Oscillospiraceae bacterium]
MINLIVENDKLTIPNCANLNKNSVNYYTLNINYTNDWDNLHKFIVFDDGLNTPTVDEITNITEYKIPQTVLNTISPKILIGIYATNGSSSALKRITTNMWSVRLSESSYKTGTTPAPPTADVWEKYMASLGLKLENNSILKITASGVSTGTPVVLPTPSITIDQIVTPTSQNAISSKAVSDFVGTQVDNLQLTDNNLQLTANNIVVGTPVILPKTIIDTEMSDTSKNPVENNVSKKYIDKKDGIKEILRVDTPPFTVQPTFSGLLNPAFKTWIYTHYYVHIVDEVAGTFKLMPNRNDVANAIAQEFTLANLNTGNSGTLKENSAVDFLDTTQAGSTATTIVMRSAGNIGFFSLNTSENYNEIELHGNGFCDISGYFAFGYLGGFNSADFKYVGTVGTYTGDSGFLISHNNYKNKNVLNVFKDKITIGDNVLSNSFSITNYVCTDEDRSIITSQTSSSGKGSAFKTDFSPINQTFSSFKFLISWPNYFLNGFELTIIRRSR